MNEKKFQAVISLSAPRRYHHFIKVAADWASVWGLWSDGWALTATDDNETPCLPLWPEKPYAELFKNGDWSHFEASHIDVYELLDELLPSFKETGYCWLSFLCRELAASSRRSRNSLMICATS